MKIIDKIFRDKKANNVIYIILAVGILMLVSANSFADIKSDSHTNTEYEKTFSLKDEAELILSEIEGVGDVSVMISFEKKKSDKTSADSENEIIQSVLVVADGGGDAVVREKIVRAMKVALGVEAHKIEVFERKEKE